MVKVRYENSFRFNRSWPKKWKEVEYWELANNQMQWNDDYRLQQLMYDDFEWMNRPFIQLKEDMTTIKGSLSNNEFYRDYCRILNN